MKGQKAALKRVDYIICPHCGEDSGHIVSHLYAKGPKTFGPWGCSACGRKFEGKVVKPGDIELRPSSEPPNSRCLSLLKLTAGDRTVWFVINGNRYHKDATDEEFQSGTKYLYEEHSCPTNWLTNCVEVIENGDDDPHGFLEFVRVVEVPHDMDVSKDGVRDLFPEAFPADVIIEGSLAQPIAMLTGPKNAD